MKKIIVSAFEPFGDHQINSTQRVLEKLENVDKMVLPVERFTSVNLLKDFAKDADAIIMLGMAANQKEVLLERVALNIDDFRIADNAQNQPRQEVQLVDGPVAFLSTLPIVECKAKLEDHNIPVNISNSAGTFVCNHLFYGVRQSFDNIPCGFVHLPSLEDMELDLMVQAVSLIVEEVTKSL